MSAGALKRLNQDAQHSRGQQALGMNIAAARGLQDVLRTNLGPRGTLKMLVSGALDIKLTKDGAVLLKEMQIQHPTATLIARTATAQDDITGDGTTSNVLLIAELLKQSERFLGEGLHPRVVADGFDLAKDEAVKFLDVFKTHFEDSDADAKGNTISRDTLVQVARTALRTKIVQVVADSLAPMLADSVLTIQRPGKPIDLFMVEIQVMPHKLASDTRLVQGLVLDHGARHPDMPKRMEHCYILTCNVSLEYEKSETTATTVYDSADKRQELVKAERKFVDERVETVIALKKKLCDGTDKTFVVLNQKGIDPVSLEALAKEGILGLRRAKRRNMERLTLACGGLAVNTLDDLDESVLGFAEVVYEHQLGEEKFTFVEGVKNPFSCTLLINGPNKHTTEQMKDAIRDGLRNVKNAVEDKALVAGAGAFQVALHHHLMTFKRSVAGRQKLGVQAFADACLIIPKTLAVNSGFDAIDTIVKLQEEYDRKARAGNVKAACGIDIETGDVIDSADEGIWDNYRVLRQMLHSAPVIATQLLLVDEVMRAGKVAKQQAPGGGGGGGMPGGGMPGMMG
jgi:T-complex protein 1 subunit zeta